MYNILVVGAGYLGSAIARDFKAKKQRVFALTRNSEKASAFEKEEIIPVLADLSDSATLEKIPPAHFIVISVAPDQPDAENYRKLYLDGIGHFLQALKKNPRPYLIVLISSTSVWKDRAGGWVDVETPVDADTEKGKILIASERLVLNSGFPAIVFRLSGIYGPERNRLRAFQSGTWPSGESKQPDGYMNMIHVEDAAQAIQPLFKKSQEGRIYLGTDDAPVLRSEFCAWLSEKTGKPMPKNIDRTRVEGKRCRNQSLKDLGVTFQYPSFREAYQVFLESHQPKGSL